MEQGITPPDTAYARMERGDMRRGNTYTLRDERGIEPCKSHTRMEKGDIQPENENTRIPWASRPVVRWEVIRASGRR